MSTLRRHIGHKAILKPAPLKTSKRDALMKLLRRANTNVPFYKDRYSDFLSKAKTYSDSDFWTEFSKTPVTTKQDLKDHNNDFQSQNFSKKYDLIVDGKPPSKWNAIKHMLIKRNFKVSISTGGTSGIPTYRWLDHGDANVMAQSFLESFHLNGWRRGQSFVVFYPLRSYFTQAYASFNDTLDDWFGFSMVPFETITIEKVQELLSTLMERDAKLLVIFPCVLQRVAELMKEHNIPPFKELDTINVSGEFLLDCSKSFIQNMFPDSDIQITYGAVEVGEVAHQYGPSSFDYLVFDDFAHLEEGADDTLLITSLQQTAFPMIRYQMEDKGTVETDDQGRQFLMNLEGKNTDFLIGADGQKYYTSFFNHMINRLNEEFGQIIIHFMLRFDTDTIQLNYVLSHQDDVAKAGIRSACLSTISRTFPQFTTIDVDFVSHFDHDYTRKFKIIGKGDGLAEVVGGYYKRQA